MQRVKDERGAVGVVVAMLMVRMVGFAAISIDAAALWNQRLQLQTGADAGALPRAAAADLTKTNVTLITGSCVANGTAPPATATVTVTVRLAFATRLFGTGVTLTGRGVMRCNG